MLVVWCGGCGKCAVVDVVSDGVLLVSYCSASYVLVNLPTS